MREAARNNTIEYEAEVRADGQLPLPRGVKLAPGRRVHVQLKLKCRRANREARFEDSPLYKLVGFIRSNKVPRDVAERHNYYLHRRLPESDDPGKA